VLVLVDNALHILDFLGYVSFLPAFLLYVHLVLLYQSFFLGNDFIFLLDDTIESIFVSSQSFDMLVFITHGHFALEVVSFKVIKLFL